MTLLAEVSWSSEASPELVGGQENFDLMFGSLSILSTLDQIGSYIDHSETVLKHSDKRLQSNVDLLKAKKLI